ncbi:GPI mannosyltransferase 2 isoform X2 [Phoenix dactylifera]|uniref:GPI mannosyltransferase 2 n=1 Tax=Phoenix dactylifera TaxID=42345 RepID=A0A8B9A8Q8_PHODC|nr:GPI mannosyltransferase 2 isoform X2 [Phoenix dactylifera]
MAKAEGFEGLVLRRALLSRLLILTLILLWRLLFRPYDTSASLNPSCLSAAGGRSLSAGPILWPRIGAAIEASVVWDGVYFVRIAECGYEYEQTYAFFPLLPLCISLLSRSVFAPLVPMIGSRAVLALSGYVLNNVAFLFAAVYFYRLSVLILKDPAAAFRASILFCFNPASVFYSSIYTESLYALFSLGGLYYLFSGATTVAMLLLALSGSARSNGVLNAGYFCFQAMQHAYDAIIQKKRPILAGHAVIGGVARSICIFVPFLAFQAYGYSNICLGGFSYELRPWCKARIPNLYGFLQNHYWGVGFLRYFQVKQLPNFLLASPILSLAICSIIHYASVLLQVFRSLDAHDHNSFAALLSLLGTNEISDAVGVSKNNLSSKTFQEHTVRRRKQERKNKSTESFQHLMATDHALLQSTQGYPSILVFPFILHLAFLTFTALFVMHVQVNLWLLILLHMITGERNLARLVQIDLLSALESHA